MANDVIIDEILCFVSNAIDTLPGDDLIASCVSAFDVSDIRRSKLQFFTYCKRLSGDADIPNGGIKHIARRGDSPVNDIKDIIKLFQELGDQAPRYVALNLRNVPQVLSVANPDVNKLLLAFDSLKAEVSALKTVVDTQQTAMALMKDQLARPTYAATLATERPVNNARNDRRPPPSGRIANPPSNAQENGSNNARNTDGENKYQYPRRRKRRFHKGTKQTPIGDDNTGNSKIVGVKAIKTAHVFVTRLPHDCEADDVKQFIKDNLNLEATVEKVRSAQTSNDITSFHISCQCDDPKVFFDSLLWPEHCLYRRWWPKRKTTQSGDPPDDGASAQG